MKNPAFAPGPAVPGELVAMGRQPVAAERLQSQRLSAEVRNANAAAAEAKLELERIKEGD